MSGDFELVVSEGPEAGQAYPFPGQHFFVGAGADCELRFKANLVQPKHAEIRFDSKGVPWVRDLTAQGLTWLNGEVVEQGMLAPGSFLRLGRLELVVRQRAQAAGPSGTLATPTPMPSDVLLGEVETPSRIRRGGPPLTPGTIIDGRYEIVSKIASGGMGEVYRAQHVELGKTMALKVMLPELSDDPEFVARFKREAIAASRIGQQNIVDISDFGRTSSGRFYFVMEYLDGVTLASLLNQHGALPPARVFNICLQVARALAAAHAQSIVHRDLKPENIMVLQRLGQPDFVKVLDFGVAKVSHGQGKGGQTALGIVVGTPQYMSPEQAKAVSVDLRSDIYSLGLIVYELLAGRPTFVAETPSMLMVKHITEPPPPFAPGLLGSIPQELVQLIFRMLEKEPQARPQSIEEIIVALDSVWTDLKSGEPTLKRVSGSMPRVAVPEPGAASSQREGLDAAMTEPHLEEPRPPSRHFKLIIALSAAVVALTIWVLVVLRQPTQPPLAEELVRAPAAVPRALENAAADPKPVAVEPKVKLSFAGSPAKLDVMEGDVLVGVTPVSLSREAGSIAVLTFSAKGFVPMTRKVRFDTDQTIPIELEKEKKTGPAPKPKSDLAEDPYPQEEDLKESPF